MSAKKRSDSDRTVNQVTIASFLNEIFKNKPCVFIENRQRTVKRMMCSKFPQRPNADKCSRIASIPFRKRHLVRMSWTAAQPMPWLPLLSPKGPLVFSVKHLFKKTLDPFSVRLTLGLLLRSNQVGWPNSVIFTAPSCRAILIWKTFAALTTLYPPSVTVSTVCATLLFQSKK